MPLLTVPDGDPLSESNPCHAPGGSAAGGQFCATPGGTLPKRAPKGPVMKVTFGLNDRDPLHREVQAEITLIAKGLGFPPEQIEVHSSLDAPKYTLADGTSFHAGATFSPSTGKITFYSVPLQHVAPAPMYSDAHLPPGYNYKISGTPGAYQVTLYKGGTTDGQELVQFGSTDWQSAWQTAIGALRSHAGLPEVPEGQPQPHDRVNRAALATMVAHEVQHARFDVVMRMHKTEQVALQAHDAKIYRDYADKPYHELAAALASTPSGEIRPAFQTRFPVSAALDPFLTPPGSGELANKDGISEYSTMWWTAYKNGHGFAAGGHNAKMSTINETLAEVAANLASTKYGRKMESPKGIWRKFYHAINTQHDILTVRRRRPRAAG